MRRESGAVVNLQGEPLSQMRRPAGSEVVCASEIEVNDLIWAMAERPFVVTRISRNSAVVILRSQGHSKESRAQNMVLNPETKLVRLQSGRVGGAG